MAGFDITRLKGHDRFVVGGGALVLIASFLPWYGYSAKLAGLHFSDSFNGWHGGWAVLGIVAAVAAASFAVLGASSRGSALSLPAGPALITMVLAVCAAAFLLVRWTQIPSGGALGVDYGPKYGLFLALCGAVVQAVFAVLAFRASGEDLPGAGPSSTPPATP